jgi:predicted Zn-dependent peptidase
MTIGKELSHIENARLEDVKVFFHKHYNPSNAILTIGGNITISKAKELVEKWFGDIPAGEKYVRNILQEPIQDIPHFLEVNADVPLDALYKCWHVSSRLDKRYYVADLITEILGNGASSRLYQVLVKEKQLFSYISCSHTGSIDPGLLVIEGKLREGITIEEGEREVMVELQKMKDQIVTESELQKVKNRVESLLSFEDISLINRVNSLANYELLGNANLMNEELESYQAVTAEDILQECNAVFIDSNCSTLYYRSATLKIKN